MYQPGGDMPQFRPVPAAPPPLRMMGPPLMPPPPSTTPGRPPIHGPMPGRPPLMQQYMYPPPASQHPPPAPAPQPLLAPPPVSSRGFPPPSLHPSLQPSLPTMGPNIPPSPVPSVHPSRPLLQPPLPPLQAGFSSMQPAIPAMQPVPTPFQPPLMQVPPPPSYVPAPLPLIQPPPFLPPLPTSPPSENPPPPPPPSPPPQPPPLPLVEEPLAPLAGALLPPEPPKPSDPEMLKNIDVLAAFVAKNGPRFESMARARQAGDPKFAFLFESDASPEAAIGHEFYKWKKQSYAVEFGLENENKKNNLADLGAASGRDLHARATPGQPLMRDAFPASPTKSDMDMEDDFTPSPPRHPMGHPESIKEHDAVKSSIMGSEMVQKNARASVSDSTNNMRTMHEANASLKGVFPDGTSQKRSFQNGSSEALLASLDGKNLETAESSSKNQFSNLLNTEEDKQVDGQRASIKDGAGRGSEQSKGLRRLSDVSSGNTGLEHPVKLDIKAMSVDAIPKHSERRMGRSSRWESLSTTQPNAAPDVSKHDLLPHNEDGSVRKVEETSSPRYHNDIKSFVDRATGIDKASEGNPGSGRPPDTGILQPEEEALSVDEFGRLIRKEAIESESDDDVRPRKRRRSYSRSRSQSRSRGRGRSRSRSRSRGRNRSKSRSLSYSSGESRWRRQGFSRSPRRGRRSRSRSRSPGRWPRNESRSPSRDMRWGGMGRGDRDWRGEREPYGRGRRAGRGSGPSVCFHFARGRCFRGTACKFLHPEKEIGQERGMLSTDVQAPAFKDAEFGQGAFAGHKSLIGADSDMDRLHGGTEIWEAGRTESNRETDSIHVDSVKANSVIRSPGSNREVFALSDNSPQAVTVAGTGSTSEKGRYGSRFAIENTQSVGSLAAADEDAEKAGENTSKKAQSDEVVAKSDNREIGLTAESSEVHERLKATESTSKDADEKLDTNGSKKLTDGIPQTNQGSELKVGDMNIRVQLKDTLDGGTSPHEPSEIVLDEKRSSGHSTGESQRPSEGKGPKKSVPDFALESAMLESKDTPRKGSAEPATARSEVGLEGPGGSDKLKTSLIGSSSPIPFLPANVKGESMHFTSASDNLSDQRHGSGFGHQPLESWQHPSSAAKRSSPQLQALPSPPLNIFPSTSSGFSIGNFTPSHLISSQAPSLGSGNAGHHNTFSINNNQHTPIHQESMRGALRSQPSHSASFPPLLGFSQNTSQQSSIPPQDHLPNFITHQPRPFAVSSSMLHGHGMPSFPVKEPQDWSGSFSSAKEDSSYARLFGDGEKQYMHSNPPNDVLQHAYPRQVSITSAASVGTPMAWKNDSLAGARSVLVSSAEKPHYSYTLTTIPPLPNIVKMPGGSSVPGAGEQYDPLSDVLDLGSSGALKSLSSKTPSDGRPVTVGFLENLSPGLDPEKANISAPKLEVDNLNLNEAAADVGVVENVSPPGDWSPVQPGDAAIGDHDQSQSKSRKSNRGLKLLRTAVADRVKALLKQPWKEGRLSKDAFKTIAKKAVEKVTGNLPSHHIPKSQEKVDQFMSVSGSKIAKLVQGYVDKYSKVQS